MNLLVSGAIPMDQQAAEAIARYLNRENARAL